MAAVDVQDLAGVIQGAGVVGDVEMAGGLVGLAVAQHIEGVAGIVLAEGVNDGVPSPGGSAEGMQHYQREAAALLEVVDIPFAGGDGIGQVAADEHSNNLLELVGKGMAKVFPILAIGGCGVNLAAVAG